MSGGEAEANSQEQASDREAGIPPSSERDQQAMSRRTAWFLIALAAWTLWVWGTRIWIIAGQDQSTGFKVVHDVLAVISIAFGLVAGWIGVRGLRARRSP